MDEHLKALSLAFWLEVMSDLVRGDLMTYLWLYTGTQPQDFEWWSEVTGKDPNSWREGLVRLWGLRGTEKARKMLRAYKESMRE